MIHFRSKDSNSINFRSFLDHFQVRKETSELLNNIKNQLRTKKVNLDEVTTQKRLNLKEFMGVIERTRLEIAQGQISTLERLFD